jgi:pimeloyl-ACP methyl ester carboxylesterase
MSELLPVHVVVHGEGAPILLLHGSAADHTTWTIQVAGLRKQARLIAPDRRGTDASPLPAGAAAWSVGQHADDAAAVIEAHAGGGPVVACGSSFGGVVTLELVRRHPALVRGAVLIEPPLPPADDRPAVPASFLAEIDRVTAEQGGPEAARLFLRTVLGEAAYARMPRAYQERSAGLWRQIRADLDALAGYRVGYGELGAVTTPILLLGGERSAVHYRPTLEALAAALGNAWMEILAGAGHMLHADVHRAFNARLLAFAAEVGGLGAAQP